MSRLIDDLIDLARLTRQPLTRETVDLSEIDADETTGGNQAFQIVAMFTDTPGEIILRYSAGKDRTTLRGDTDGDSIADLVIALDGDQTGFAGFVL